MTDGTPHDEAHAGTEPPAEQSPKPSRKQRRDQKRRLHEAQKKAKGIERTNDRRGRIADMRDRKDLSKADKKTEKGMHEKADKKAEKVKRRREKRMR